MCWKLCRFLSHVCDLGKHGASLSTIKLCLVRGVCCYKKATRSEGVGGGMEPQAISPVKTSTKRTKRTKPCCLLNLDTRSCAHVASFGDVPMDQQHSLSRRVSTTVSQLIQRFVHFVTSHALPHLILTHTQSTSISDAKRISSW